MYVRVLPSRVLPSVFAAPDAQCIVAVRSSMARGCAASSCCICYGWPESPPPPCLSPPSGALFCLSLTRRFDWSTLMTPQALQIDDTKRHNGPHHRNNMRRLLHPSAAGLTPLYRGRIVSPLIVYCGNKKNKCLLSAPVRT